MTHSLHRKGKRSDLENDYIILAMLAANFNNKYEDSRRKLIEIGEILKKYNPINIMSEAAWKMSPVITATFTEIEIVKKIIKEFKEKDFGISIVISGLIIEIEAILSEIGLKTHTVHLSLGTFGKKELLPLEDTLEITTMCGHHCISPTSVSTIVKQVALKKISIDKAIKKLSKPCVCGIFNESRAYKILTSMIKKHTL